MQSRFTLLLPTSESAADKVAGAATRASKRLSAHDLDRLLSPVATALTSAAGRLIRR